MPPAREARGARGGAAAATRSCYALEVPRPGLLTRFLALALALAACGCDKAPVDATPATQEASAPASAAAAPTGDTTTAPASSPPDAIIAQHLLVAYRTAKRAPRGVTRSKADAKARAAEALARIRSGTPFEDAVKEYSDDAGSADRMGSLGKFTRDAMDPAFAAAAFALAVGQVSDPVETPFGFHIIKRTQ